MSLDVYLSLAAQKGEDGSGIFIREDGAVKEITRAEWDEKFPNKEPVIVSRDDEGDLVYTANITHNLNNMADEAGIYKHLWRPDEIDVGFAHQLIDPLEEGLQFLKENPQHYKRFNPSNGWGDYEGLVSFVERYLEACKKYPQAEVSVWR